MHLPMNKTLSCIICGGDNVELPILGFPENRNQRAKWCYNLKIDAIPKWDHSKHICSRHFESYCFDKPGELRPGAAPTLHLNHDDTNIFFSDYSTGIPSSPIRNRIKDETLESESDEMLLVQSPLFPKNHFILGFSCAHFRLFCTFLVPMPHTLRLLVSTKQFLPVILTRYLSISDLRKKCHTQKRITQDVPYVFVFTFKHVYINTYMQSYCGKNMLQFERYIYIDIHIYYHRYIDIHIYYHKYTYVIRNILERICMCRNVEDPVIIGVLKLKLSAISIVVHISSINCFILCKVKSTEKSLKLYNYFLQVQKHCCFRTSK